MSSKRKGKICRHCNARPVTRSRGLCWNCFYDRGVRDLYPIDPNIPQNRRGVEEVSPKDVPPLEPTKARPGTPEKRAVVARRVELGQPISHPKDATHESE